MRRFVIVGVLVGLTAGAARWWLRHRRFGAGFVNRFVNPVLMGRRLAGFGRSELGTIEHIGRRSGMRRLTPVHPEPTVDGFRIVVPLAAESEWARNVIAAGHCRLQLHDVVYELDEPRLIAPEDVEDLPRILRRLETALGFRYLALRRFNAAAGQLEALATPVAPVEEVPEVAAKVEPGVELLVASATAASAPAEPMAVDAGPEAPPVVRRTRTQRRSRSSTARR